MIQIVNSKRIFQYITPLMINLSKDLLKLDCLLFTNKKKII